MNGGDRPKRFDRGPRRCYGRPSRRLSLGRSVFQTPGAPRTYSDQFLDQFVTDMRRLGQTLCATSLGNTVLDLSACLLPGWWSAGTPRRGLPSASRVTALSRARRHRRAGFQGAEHKRVIPDSSPEAAAEPTDTLSRAPDASTGDARRESGLAQSPDPGSVIEPTDLSPERPCPVLRSPPASDQSGPPPPPVDPWITRPHTPPQRVADTRRQPMRLFALFEEFCHFLRVEKGATPATIATYRWCFGDFLAFVMKQVGGTALLTHFTEETCRSYQYDLANRELKTGTIRLRVATLGSFGKWMVRRDKVVRNPVDRLTRPRRKARVPAVPAWHAVKALLDRCTLRERAMLALMALGGLRRGEVAALDVGDVVLDFGLRRVLGKGGHEVPVALSTRARAILRDYVTAERAGAPLTAPLFVVTYVNKAGLSIERRITGQRIWKVVRAAGKRTGIPALHPHALRHACGAELLRRTKNLRLVQEQLRHADVQTTTGYTRSPSKIFGRDWKRSTTRGNERGIHVPPPRGLIFWGEKHHEITVVAPRGHDRTCRIQLRDFIAR